MDNTPANDEPQITGNVLLYNSPEPLSLELHRGLGAKRVDRPFAFLGTTHIVPLTVAEFAMAASSFPIIFVGDDKSPVAVMGARAGENVFVTELGEPDPEMYVPAFARRYPFVFAADEQSDRLLLCIDRTAPMIGTEPDVPFFDGDQPSQYTQDAIEFCKEFEVQRRATEQFIALLNQHDLLEQKSVSFTPRLPDGSAGEPQKIADYWAISEERLNKLPTDVFLQMRDQGVIAAAYAHLLSLLLWPRVIQRTIRRFEETQSRQVM